MRSVLDLRFPDPADVSGWRAFADRSAAIATVHLTAQTADALRGFFRSEGPDALLIENLPVDPELPLPPANGRRPASKTAISEAVIAGLIEQYATILAYSNEKAGAPIHEIAPAAGLEHVASSTGRVPFPCHTDVAFLAPDFSPRGLLLFGLLNQNNAPTSLVPLDHVLNSLSSELKASLAKPIFRHPSPATFELGISAIGPVLWKDQEGAFRIAVQTHAVQATNEEARRAIAGFRQVLELLEPEQVVVGPSAALLFKNDRVLHGRAAFRGERWLQRAYFTDTIERFRQAAHAESREFAFDARKLLGAMAAQKSLAPSESISHSKN
jgi:hypothetical protein